MGEVVRFFDSLGKLPVYALSAAVGLVALAMILITERRTTVVLLLAQQVLINVLIVPEVYTPAVLVRIGTAVASCLILYITAGHMQMTLGRSRDSEHHASLAEILRASSSGGMGLGFRLVLRLFGALLVYGIWTAFPLAFITRGYGPALYAMVIMGILMLLISLDPLRRGVGILAFLGGFEGIYLHLEQSLVVMQLLGIVDILIALAVAYLADLWLATLAEGEGAE